ncbi:GA-binding protein subunit beta-2, partial [Coturnix japonica]|uniref:GA-binding protein subunit beta-2 n=1 Tax=Coturnix japonica TaxID=93934 RepID=UPI0013A5EDBB
DPSARENNPRWTPRRLATFLLLYNREERGERRRRNHSDLPVRAAGSLSLNSAPCGLFGRCAPYPSAAAILRERSGKGRRAPVLLSDLDPHGHAAVSVRGAAGNGADVNAKDMLEMTALHWAAEHNHWDVAELLVRHKGDVHATSMSDTSPFDSALDRSNLETLMILQESTRERRIPSAAL